MTTSTDQFSQLLRGAVAGYAARTGMKKRVIAERCGYSPGMLSHLLSGKRRPGSRQAVLALSRALELSRADANRLLTALDYSPISGAEVGAVLLERRIAQVSVEELPQPDRDLLSAVMNNDLRLLSAAWRQYVDVREEARHRNWAQVAARSEEARALQSELAAIGPRFAAWLELSEAQSHRYQGRLDDARIACVRGLAASQLAGSPPIRARLLVRLADIEKLQGNFAGANEHYGEARQVIAEWNPATETERQFAAWWDARIKRELGNLFLFMALPREAQPLLEESHDYFQAEGNKYEEAHACHSLGWGAHQLGDWDAGLEWHQRAVELGRQLDAERGWRDTVSALHDSLYVGLALLDHGDHAAAEDRLQRSLAAPDQNPEALDYHEAGVAHLALSRVYRAQWQKRDMALAEMHARQGLEFYARMPVKDPLRMASAHNTNGDVMMDLGRVAEAKLDFEAALQWALSSNPPNRYYEAKARLRRASAQLAQTVEQRRPTRDIQLLMSLESTQDVITDRSAEGPPASNFDQSRRLLDQAIEELATADGLCREYGYDQLLAQVKLMEARVLSAQGFSEPSTEACWEGLTAALGTNRFVLNETWKAVEALAMKSPGSTLLADMRQRLNGVAEEVTSGRDAAFVKAVRLLCGADSDDEALRTENAQA